MFDFLTDELYYQFVMRQRDTPNLTNTKNLSFPHCKCKQSLSDVQISFIYTSYQGPASTWKENIANFIWPSQIATNGTSITLNHLSSHGWTCEKNYSWHPLLLVFNVIIKHNLVFEQQVKHMNTVQVKHVNVIPLFHFFQHDVNTAHDWQPAESTRSGISCAKNMKWDCSNWNVGDYFSTTDI